MKKLRRDEAIEFLKVSPAEYDLLLQEGRDKKHSDLSASGSERWLNCPASVSECKKAEEEEPNIYSLEGSLAHKYLEDWLCKIAKNQFVEYVPKGLKRNNDMFVAVREAANFVKYSLTKRDELLVEEKADLSFIHPDMFGTSDIGIVSEFDRLESWDYKHGKGYAVDVVEKKEFGPQLNSQLMFYIIALAVKYHFNFRKYLIGVYQPRAEHKDGPSRSVEITRKDIETHIDLFKRGVDRVYSKKPKHFVGRWCKWCKGKDFCPKQEKIKYEKNQDMFSDIGG